MKENDSLRPRIARGFITIGEALAAEAATSIRGHLSWPAPMDVDLEKRTSKNCYAFGIDRFVTTVRAHANLVSVRGMTLIFSHSHQPGNLELASGSQLVSAFDTWAPRARRGNGSFVG